MKNQLLNSKKDESRLRRDGCLNRFLRFGRNDTLFSLILLVWGGLAFATAEPNSAVDTVDAAAVIESPATEAVFAPATQIQSPRYRLLPLKTDLINENPLPLYLTVFTADPNHPELDPDFAFIDAQLVIPANAMDLVGVQTELEKCSGKLEMLRQGSLCKTIEWPRIKQQYRWQRDERMMMFAVFPSDDETDYKRPVFSPTQYLDFMLDIQRYGKLVALKARYHIVQGEYDQGVLWLRVGFCISRQMVTESNLQLGMAAASNAAVCLQQIELWVQTPGSPSLHRALGDLPQPFLNTHRIESLTREITISREYYRMGLDVRQSEETLNAETETFLSDYTNEQFDHAAGQIDRYVAILECIEGLRYYAAMYVGDLPQHLAEITELRMPVDPVTRQAFVYSKGWKGFALKAPDWDTDESRFGFKYFFRFE